MPQTAGEWVVGLARGESDVSPGEKRKKKYHISRRRKKRVAVVNHKDRLVLERVAFSTKKRDQQRTDARRNFEQLVRAGGDQEREIKVCISGQSSSKRYA